MGHIEVKSQVVRPPPPRALQAFPEHGQEACFLDLALALTTLIFDKSGHLSGLRFLFGNMVFTECLLCAIVLSIKIAVTTKYTHKSRPSWLLKILKPHIGLEVVCQDHCK